MLDDNKDDDTLGNRILRAREAGAMSHADITRKLGIKKTTLESWENDLSEPGTTHLIRLSGILGVSPTWLLDGVGAAPRSELISDEVQILRNQLEQIKQLRDQTTNAIGNMERALDRLIEKED